MTSLTGTACEAYYIYTYKYMWLFDMFNLEINKLYFQMSGYKLVSNACYVIDWGGGLQRGRACRTNFDVRTAE